MTTRQNHQQYICGWSVHFYHSSNSGEGKTNYIQQKDMRWFDEMSETATFLVWKTWQSHNEVQQLAAPSIGQNVEKIHKTHSSQLSVIFLPHIILRHLHFMQSYTESSRGLSSGKIKNKVVGFFLNPSKGYIKNQFFCTMAAIQSLCSLEVV